MLQEIITQVDSQCGNCGDELPKGSRCYIKNYYDKTYCLGCVAEELKD